MFQQFKDVQVLDTSCLKIYVYGALKWRLARLLKSLTDIIEQVHSSPASSSYAMKTFAAVLAAGVLGKHTTFDIFQWQEKDGKWRSSNYRTVTSVTDPSLLPTFADTLGLSHRGFASWHAPGTAPSSSYTPAILSILLGGKKNDFKPIVWSHSELCNGAKETISQSLGETENKPWLKKTHL